MPKLISILILFLNYHLALGQHLNKDQQKAVSDFIECIKYHKKATLTDNIRFPFSRDYPIPQIKTRKEFLTRYNEVFDDSLTKIISNSKLQDDWSAVGWRGMMLLDGLVWLDDDGNLIAVKYQSNYEKQTKLVLIQNEKKSLHTSIKSFNKPVNILETSAYRIRIDDLGDGKYRYASWPLKNKMSAKPDIIITGGECKFEGSGGDHTFIFYNKGFTYECSINITGPDDTPPAFLTIYKRKKEVLSQKAIIVTK